MIRIFIIATIILQAWPLAAQMDQIDNFGSNPGNLEMYLFIPSTPKIDAEVVLVLHGCGQKASRFAEQTGWNALAEHFGFYVVYAQQLRSNNLTKCFNWFLPSDNQRDKGEAKSLVEMVQYVHKNYDTDQHKSFVCGLSAGGSMTPVLMATYPDIFLGGGVWAGVPYLYAPSGDNDISSAAWGEKVRSAFPSYSGPYPTLFICQGTQDEVVDPINEERLIAQWTDVHQANQISDGSDQSFQGNPKVEKNIYINNVGDTIINSYRIAGMGHGIAVDPGNGLFQGGQTSSGAFDVDFFSTYWMADFFGILDDNITHLHEDSHVNTLNVNTLKDGSIRIVNHSKNKHLRLVVFDVSGKVIVRKPLLNDVVIPVNVINHKTIILLVSDEKGKRVFSQVYRM